MRTQVGIIGAGPAGLMLSHLLARQGVESIVLEQKSREYVEQRVRAGVLEHDSVELLERSGVGDRVRREGLVHEGIELRFNRSAHRVALAELTGGRTITVYGQQEVVKDLAAARIADGGTILYEVDDVEVSGIDSTRPVLSFTSASGAGRVECDYVAGCDGFHGVSRRSIPPGALRSYDWHYPFAWLGILATVAPSTEELIYARHERGFALHSLRSPHISRLYLQCEPSDDVASWSDDRIWTELATRLSTDDGWELHEGPIIEKAISAMRSFVVEPMSYGRLFLAGDAAHIVPATGAKGLNLALADVRVLADALGAACTNGEVSGLAAYSATCLRRVWRVQHFSWWMTSMLHRPPDQDDFHDRLQLAELAYTVSSRAASTTLAENYVGLREI